MTVDTHNRRLKQWKLTDLLDFADTLKSLSDLQHFALVNLFAREQVEDGLQLETDLLKPKFVNCKRNVKARTDPWLPRSPTLVDDNEEMFIVLRRAGLGAQHILCK